jgi:hypothetical protein
VVFSFSWNFLAVLRVTPQSLPGINLPTKEKKMSEEVKQAVLDYFKSKAKTKTKFYMNDLRKVAPDMKNREFKKIISEMINDGTLMYYSTGSTTMFQLAEEDVDAGVKE